MIRNVYWSSCKVPGILVRFELSLNFPRLIFEKYSNTKFYGNQSSESGQTDGQTRRRLQSLFAFLRTRQKKILHLAGFKLRSMKQAIMNTHTFVHSLCCASVLLCNTVRCLVHLTSTGRALSRTELVLYCCVNLLKPNDIYIYMSYRIANLQTLHFKYLFNKYTYRIF